MEKYSVIGIQHKTGVYQGSPFDNMLFSVTSPGDVSKGEVGDIATVLKIKTSLLTSVPAVGDEVVPIYDRYGRITGFMN